MLALMLAAAALSPAGWPAPDPRPTFHYAPARNWMNDPNGLVYFDGEYHLFYQYNPYGDRWGHMNWGHAVSRDLIDWRELPVAIPEADGRMAFSGSAVIDHANTAGFGRDAMIAIYTGWSPDNHNQSQFLAYSTDRGRSFTRYGKVIDIGSTEFRDPKVFWHEGTKRWVMIAVDALANKVMLFASPDLKRWTRLSDFGPAGARGKNWECPDLFELPVEGGRPGEKRWVLSVNLGADAIGGGSGGQWFVGDFDGTRFTLEPGWSGKPHWMDTGADFYAAVTWNGVPDGRRIWIGWANDWRYARDIPTYPSRGLMTVSRTVSLRRESGDWAISQAPVAEIERHRGPPLRVRDLTLGDAPRPLAIGEEADVTMTIDPGRAQEVSLDITDAQGWQTRIGYTPATREVWVDRTRSGPPFHDAFPDRHVATLPVESAPAGAGPVTVRLLVDRSIVELYAADGTRTITDRFFRGGGPLRWSARSVGGGATIRALDAWPIAAR